MTLKKTSAAASELVPLAGLAPARQAGSRGDRRLFGARSARSKSEAAAMSRKTRDLPASKKTHKDVKGGGTTYQDNITLVRAAKPAPKNKDLATRKDVKGGQKVRE
jgi:hypothetical protein